MTEPTTHCIFFQNIHLPEGREIVSVEVWDRNIIKINYSGPRLANQELVMQSAPQELDARQAHEALKALSVELNAVVNKLAE